MSRPRYLADHDLNQIIVRGLLRREPTIDVALARDLGLQDRPDPEVLARAAELGLIVVSHDRKTMTMYARQRIEAGLPMPGLLVADQTTPIRAVIDSIILVWAAGEVEDCADRIIFLPI